jgi:hypothetical protein
LRVVEIVPVAVVEIVPVEVVDIVPAEVVEMVPAFVVEMVPPFDNAGIATDNVITAANRIDLKARMVFSCHFRGFGQPKVARLEASTLGFLRNNCRGLFQPICQ